MRYQNSAQRELQPRERPDPS